jgi:hypothetical protein
MAALVFLFFIGCYGSTFSVLAKHKSRIGSANCYGLVTRLIMVAG